MRRVRARVAAVIAVALATVAPPAAAADCPSPGGQPIERTASPTGDFVVIGGGFGHGAGMSQYGARGAALLGCSRRQILAAYYPGAAVRSAVADTFDNIRVSLVPSHPDAALPRGVSVTAVSSGVVWRSGDRSRTQPAGVTWRARVSRQGLYTVRQGDVVVLGPAEGPVRIRLRGRVVRLPVKNHRYHRGSLLLSWSGRGRNTLVTNRIPGLDPYLYGLAEMPSSWPRAALGAQAVAARSYALQRREARDRFSAKWAACRCDVYDSVADQAFAGYDWESVAPRWTAAVDATSGRVLRHGGRTATAYYHSSSGGHTESAGFVFGNQLAYSQPVDDSRWERASGSANTTWLRTFSAEQLGRAFDVGVATAVDTPAPRGQSGRVGDPSLGAGGVVVVGTEGSVHVSGPQFRFTLGLPSALFWVQPPAE